MNTTSELVVSCATLKGWSKDPVSEELDPTKPLMGDGIEL